MPEPRTPPETLYDRVGGEPFFVALVDHFYVGVENDSALRSMYPSDLGPSRRHLALFLVQYWGGPTTYADERGHPMLRMRHFPFGIGQAERAAWLRHMRAAVDSSSASAQDREALLAYFETAATHLVNRPQ